MIDDAVLLARQAGVGRLCLFHHDPARGDDAVDALERAAQAEWPSTQAAREGDVVCLQAA